MSAPGAVGRTPHASIFRVPLNVLFRGVWLASLLHGIRLFAQESHVPLNEGWSFCQAGKERWYPAEVPGVVQTDLLRNGLIPDFYKGSNIDSVQWIENEDWIYKRTIVANDSLLKNGHVDLVFKGLDTFAEVYLNDSLLGKADNMFRTWEWPIKEKLKRGANELKVIFRSPITEGSKLREAYGIQLPHDNDPTGVSPYIRKAAYQFGWDFCPRLVTSGIWQEVELRGWSDLRIVLANARLDPDRAGLWAQCFAVTNDFADTLTELEFELDGRKQRFQAPDPRGGNEVWFELDSVDLWRPGNTALARTLLMSVRLVREGRELSRWQGNVGFRSSRWLVQSKDSIGSKFEFWVNGTPMFMRGCNIVPPDLLLPRCGESAWVDLVRAMKRANMNMARIWAGGVYPPDIFYTACDTAGILVWQDFMFANPVPWDSAFVSNVDEEVYQQCWRLAPHPCVALYCGNNELDVAWRNWGWQDRYHLHGSDSVRVDTTNRRFFNKELAWWTHKPYVPTSPLSNWGNAEGLKSGDLHYWGVWHGDSAFSSFKNNVGRFVSEYGFESYPDSALLSHYIDPKELYLGSPAVKRMQRSYKTDKPIWDAIRRELGKEPKTLGEFIEDSQEVQAKAYRMAIEAHMAAQPHCMGTLFWQLNDCWPGPSWSLIDFEGNWKPGMYEVQRLYGRAGR